MSDTGESAMSERDIKLVEKLARAARWNGGDATSGGSNGKSWFNVNSILQALTIAGIVGLFTSISSLKESAVRVETTINERGKQYDRDIQRIDTTLERHDKRITDLEQGRGPSQPNADNRQKR